MRKIFLIISCLFIFVLVSCGKIQKSEPVNDLNLTIAHQLQALDNNYSDETLKALSIALRNNTMINHNEINDEKVELKYLNIARSTDGKVLKNNKDDLIEISFNKTEDYAWQKNIKKNQPTDLIIVVDLMFLLAEIICKTTALPYQPIETTSGCTQKIIIQRT